MGQSCRSFWCVIHRISCISMSWIHGVLSGNCLNKVFVVTKSVVKWRIAAELCLALTMLDGSQCTLSSSKALTSCVTSSHSTWIHWLIVKWSCKCCSTNTRKVLSLLHSHVTSVVATILPVQTILGWGHDMTCVLGTYWEAPGELAVVTD